MTQGAEGWNSIPQALYFWGGREGIVVINCRVSQVSGKYSNPDVHLQPFIDLLIYKLIDSETHFC